MRDGQMCLYSVMLCVYVCVLLSRDFAQFFGFFFSATVGLTVTP